MKKGGEILRHFSGTCGGSFPFPNCQGPFLPFRISGKARCKHSHDRYQQQAAAQSQYYQHCFSELSICLDGSVYPVRKKQESETTSISACNLPPPQSAEWVLPVRETCIFYFIRSSDPDQGRLAKAAAFASSSVISKRDCRRVKESRLDNIDIR